MVTTTTDLGFALGLLGALLRLEITYRKLLELDIYISFISLFELNPPECHVHFSCMRANTVPKQASRA